MNSSSLTGTSPITTQDHKDYVMNIADDENKEIDVPELNQVTSAQAASQEESSVATNELPSVSSTNNSQTELNKKVDSEQGFGTSDMEMKKEIAASDDQITKLGTESSQSPVDSDLSNAFGQQVSPFETVRPETAPVVPQEEVVVLRPQTNQSKPEGVPSFKVVGSNSQSAALKSKPPTSAIDKLDALVKDLEEEESSKPASDVLVDIEVLLNPRLGDFLQSDRGNLSITSTTTTTTTSTTSATTIHTSPV